MARQKKKLYYETRYNTYDRLGWHAHFIVVGWQVHSNVQRTLAVGIWHEAAQRHWECPIVLGFWNLPATPRRQRQWTTNSRSTRWVSRSLLSMTRSVFWATYIAKHVLHLQFPALRSKHVYIRDKVAVLETINAIRQSGVNNLQVQTLISI